MSKYIAMKAAPTIMCECNNPGCGCFTLNGYYLQYRTNKVDSMLFVCENCYDEKFRNDCIQENFDTDPYIMKTGAKRYQVSSPVLKKVIRWWRGVSKFIR